MKTSFQAAQVVQHILGWLSSYLEKSGMEGWVVGVSGGIDSAVTSTLCALTGDRVRRGKRNGASRRAGKTGTACR